MTSTAPPRVRPGSRARPARLALLALALSAVAVLARLGDPAGAAELRITAPSAPGSGWDHVAQALRAVLADERGEFAVTVDNAPGLAGAAGLAKFLASGDDGLLVTGLTMVGSAALHRPPGALEEATPVARLSAEPFAIATGATSPYATIDDLAAAIRADPSKATWAGGPVGSIDHVAALLFARALGADPARLPYGPFLATGDALGAGAEGQVAAVAVPAGELAGELKAGRVRVLAVAAAERQAGLDAPTLFEAAIPLELANWRGVVARPGLPAPARDRLLRQVELFSASRIWRDTLEKRGWRSAFLPGEAFGAFLRAEGARVRGALKAAGLLKRPD